MYYLCLLTLGNPLPLTSLRTLAWPGASGRLNTKAPPSLLTCPNYWNPVLSHLSNWRKRLAFFNPDMVWPLQCPQKWQCYLRSSFYCKPFPYGFCHISFALLAHSSGNLSGHIRNHVRCCTDYRYQSSQGASLFRIVGHIIGPHISTGLLIDIAMGRPSSGCPWNLKTHRLHGFFFWFSWGLPLHWA